MTNKPYISHDDATIASFQRDPAFAWAYVNDVLEEGDEREVLLALRRVAQAFGGIEAVAAKAGLNPKTLYRTLSDQGNPEWRTVFRLLRALNARFGIVASNLDPLSSVRVDVSTIRNQVWGVSSGTGGNSVRVKEFGGRIKTNRSIKPAPTAGAGAPIDVRELAIA